MMLMIALRIGYASPSNCGRSTLILACSAPAKTEVKLGAVLMKIAWCDKISDGLSRERRVAHSAVVKTSGKICRLLTWLGQVKEENKKGNDEAEQQLAGSYQHRFRDTVTQLLQEQRVVASAAGVAC